MTTNLNIRTDKNIKEQAEEIFNQLGLNMTTAINMVSSRSLEESLHPTRIQGMLLKKDEGSLLTIRSKDIRALKN